jgi:hypothetical protein
MKAPAHITLDPASACLLPVTGRDGRSREWETFAPAFATSEATKPD